MTFFLFTQALTTGAIPNFVDVILNFGTQAAVKDNFVDGLNASGQRVIFYGDDTWLRIFPNAFKRSAGVTSFLVSDYTEVGVFSFNFLRKIETVFFNIHSELAVIDAFIVCLYLLK